MRIRSTAAAALVAAGLSVTLTGAASAGEPEPDGDVIMQCADAERVPRELTDEEREWLEAQPPPPHPWFERSVGPGERGEVCVAPAPPGGRVHVVPGEPRPDQPFECAVPVPPRG